jgi:hypothetical protein
MYQMLHPLESSQHYLIFVKISSFDSKEKLNESGFPERKGMLDMY